MRKPILLAIFTMALFYGRTNAQQTLGETIDVTIVNVDVLVTDRKGDRVHGLLAEDFEVRENGKLQAISNFSEYVSATSTPIVSIESAPADSPKAPVAPRARRNVILFVEPMSIPSFRTKELFDSIRGLLREAIGPGDQVAITTWGKRLSVRQGFTGDLALIARSLDALETSVNGVADADGSTEIELRAEFDRSYEQFLSGKGVSATTKGESLMEPLAAATNQYLQIRQKAAAIEALMESISGVEGKKIFIMATRRFGMFAGAEFFGGKVPAKFERQLDTTKYRKSLIRTANAHGITVYPIHPEGLTQTPGVPGRAPPPRGLDNLVLFNETAALQEVATETGGVSAWGSTNIAAILPRVRDDLDDYYSLGYRGRATGKDATRAIVVQSKNPAYTVRSRRQFVEKSDKTRMSDRVVARLFQPIGGSTIAFDVSLGKIVKAGKNRWSVTVEVRIPIAELTALTHGDQDAGEFSVFVASGGSVGILSEVEQKTQPFSIPAAERARAKASHFTYELTVAVDGGADRMAIGVYDEVGKEYGLRQIDIPKR